MPLGAARGCVAARNRPAPFQEQGIEVGEARVEGVQVAQIVPGFETVAIGLEEEDVVPAGQQGVDQWTAVAAASVGRIGDSAAEEAPEAVSDLHLVIHRPSSKRASSPEFARHSNAISGVPQMG